MFFSSRLKASVSGAKVIFDDAPQSTRIAFVRLVLPEFLGENSRSYRASEKPLEAREVHDTFLAIIRSEESTWDVDQESVWEAIKHTVKNCEWPHFFDFVELVGDLLIKKDKSDPWVFDEYPNAYREKVNALFEEDLIGWRLNEKSVLTRQVPGVISQKAEAAQKLLKDKFEPAREHFRKSGAYLYQHPIDEANSIKEIISAVESVARTLAPKNSLGDSLNTLKHDSRFSKQLLDGLGKLYDFSNQTPAVRHGHPRLGKPTKIEAELAYALGTSYILYLIEVEKQSEK